jgi:hypothetical protein
MTRTLPADVARCPGYMADGEWRDGCEDCLRRTSPPADPDLVLMMQPPPIIVGECEARIAPHVVSSVRRTGRTPVCGPMEVTCAFVSS